MEKQQNQKIVVKIATEQRGVKRLFNTPSTFEQLLQTVRDQTKQPEAGVEELKITYQDGSDIVAISSDGDLTAAYEWAAVQPKGTIKFFVGDRANRKSRSHDKKGNKFEHKKQRAFSKKERKFDAFEPLTDKGEPQNEVTKQPRQKKERAPLDQAQFAQQMQQLGENMAKWGEELNQEGAEFNPKNLKRQVGYQMRQIFKGQTPEEKQFRAKKEKVEGEHGRFANKAIIISKPKDVLVGKAGEVLTAEVTFLNASKQAYEQGFHVVSCEGNEALFEDIKLPVEQTQPMGHTTVQIPIKIKSNAEACETVAKFGMTDEKGEPVGIKAQIKVRIEQ